MKAIENIGIRHRYLTQTWMFKPEEVPENYWDGEEWQQKIVVLIYSGITTVQENFWMQLEELIKLFRLKLLLANLRDADNWEQRLWGKKGVSENHIIENLEALNVKLDDDDMKAIENLGIRHRYLIQKWMYKTRGGSWKLLGWRRVTAKNCLFNI